MVKFWQTFLFYKKGTKSSGSLSNVQKYMSLAALQGLFLEVYLVNTCASLAPLCQLHPDLPSLSRISILTLRCLTRLIQHPDFNNTHFVSSVALGWLPPAWCAWRPASSRSKKCTWWKDGLRYDIWCEAEWMNPSKPVGQQTNNKGDHRKMHENTGCKAHTYPFFIVYTNTCTSTKGGWFRVTVWVLSTHPFDWNFYWSRHERTSLSGNFTQN